MLWQKKKTFSFTSYRGKECASHSWNMLDTLFKKKNLNVFCLIRNHPTHTAKKTQSSHDNVCVILLLFSLFHYAVYYSIWEPLFVVLFDGI